jgi:hypothetical protein
LDLTSFFLRTHADTVEVTTDTGEQSVLTILTTRMRRIFLGLQVRGTFVAERLPGRKAKAKAKVKAKARAKARPYSHEVSSL